MTAGFLKLRRAEGSPPYRGAYILRRETASALQGIFLFCILNSAFCIKKYGRPTVARIFYGYQQ